MNVAVMASACMVYAWTNTAVATTSSRNRLTHTFAANVAAMVETAVRANPLATLELPANLARKDTLAVMGIPANAN